MFLTKLYKYDSSQEANGYKGEDLTPYVLQGATFVEDITQELDTMEITLNGVPYGEEFTPESKFIVEIVEKLVDQEIVYQTLHFCVAQDLVNQPILSDDTYFNHHISFIEPSVVAQKRLVDNISATYKLKDVNLEQQTSYPIDQRPTFTNQSSSYTPSGNFGVTKTSYFLDQQIVRHCGKYFQYEGEIELYNPNDMSTPIDLKYVSLEDLNTSNDPNNPVYEAKFKIPKLAIYAGLKNSTNFAKIGYASIDVEIEEKGINSDEVTHSWTFPFISNSNLASNPNVYQPYYSDMRYTDDPAGTPPSFLSDWLFETGKADVGSFLRFFFYRKYTQSSNQNDATYITDAIQIKPDKNYVVSISLHDFEDNDPSTAYYYQKYTGEQPTLDVLWDNHKLRWEDVYNYDNVSYSSSTNAQTNGYTDYITYLNDPLEIYYASSTPYSALALLQKAIINSELCEKKQNTYIADVNNSNLPFYIDPNYVTKLSGTAIIENFYNQKNLWEIALEVGHYIHAIPELRFGSDDRFMFTFNELGRTDQKQNNSTKINIFNSRSVESYISATSSYVTNMVQLGGYIEEWVAPKTSNETLLVSNNTANIMTTKPIIELLEITIKRISDGVTADFTNFVFEKNVYETLGVDSTLSPNRGNSLYYELGTNEIAGGDFQLPTTSSGDPQNDYTFKKAIYIAYNGTAQTGWADIKVNDYVFKVRYRTKDDTRQNHARPDLRKYLLNSQYDRFPQHNQFNNQTDTLVDSVKFGNNIYGKLIKTGNTEYQVDEWQDNYNYVKHKGELYRINGDLYYVAKATHEIQSNCIISKIVYSKDYNELSVVVGIPSEPRFYEISEQSQIRREVAINDLLYLTDKKSNLITSLRFAPKTNHLLGMSHLRNLIFSNIWGVGSNFAQYALTVFKGDKDTDKYDQTIGQPYFYKEVFTPINAYSSENTLTYEWDMIDNYSAGDKLIGTQNAEYKSLRAVQYTDVYGKAALMDFFILGESGASRVELTNDQIIALPESPYKTRPTYIEVSGYTSYTNIDQYVGYFVVYNGIETLVTNDNKNDLGIIVGQTKAYRDDDRRFVYDLANDVYVASIQNNAPFNLLNNYQSFNSVDQYVGYYIDYRDLITNLTNKTLVTDINKNSLGIVAGETKAYEISTEYNDKGIGLLKDCREAISVNYNLQLVTSSDTFVLSPFVFLPQKTNVRVVLLSEEVNKLTNGYIDVSTFILPRDENGDPMSSNIFNLGSDVTFDGNDNTWGVGYMRCFGAKFDTVFQHVNDKHFTGEDGYTRIKAIAVICNVSLNPSGDLNQLPTTIPNKTQFVIARNIPDTFTREEALATWYFGAPNKNIFTNKQ